jgi:hypothetical protein
MAALRRVLAALVLFGGVAACGDDDAVTTTTTTPAPADITVETDFIVYRTAAKVMAGGAADCVESVIDAHLNPDFVMYDLLAGEPDFTTCGTDRISEVQPTRADLASPWVREYTVRADTLALMMLRMMGGTPPAEGFIPDGECITTGVRALDTEGLFRLTTQLMTPPFGEGIDAAFTAIAEGCGWVDAE